MNVGLWYHGAGFRCDVVDRGILRNVLHRGKHGCNETNAKFVCLSLARTNVVRSFVLFTLTHSLNVATVADVGLVAGQHGADERAANADRRLEERRELARDWRR